MLIQKFQKLLSDRFVRNIGWLGGAELVNRVFRLAATVTFARVFSEADYGMIAAIYTTFDIANTLSLRVGIGAKIIQADEAELKVVCDTSYWLNWVLCIALFIIQILIAYPIALFFETTELVWPLRALSLIYLIYPFFSIQSALIERENRLEVRAWCYASQAIVSNVIVVALALMGWGVWAVVVSMILSYPVWIIINYRSHPWRPKAAFTLYRWRDIGSFGSKMLGVELLSKLRLYIDYMIVGRFLGIEALGLYFFAFNAGLGISQSVIQALTSAWYPHFCQVRTNPQQLKKRYFGSFKTIATVIVPLVILQTSLARFYIPIIAGENWIPAIPVLVLICFAAIPMSVSRSTSQLLQAVDLALIDIKWNLIFTVFFASSILVAVTVKEDVFWVAVAVLGTQAIAIPLFSLWVTRHLFGKNSTVKNALEIKDQELQSDEEKLIKQSFSESEEITQLQVSGVEAVTTLQLKTAYLINVQTDTKLELPLGLNSIHMGKPNNRLPPDLDLSGFPHAEIISRVHASIHLDDDIYYLEDMGSSNGTYLNQDRLLPGDLRRLQSGDRISLGKEEKVCFYFHIIYS